MVDKDYSQYQDRHSTYRDRKLEKRSRQKLLRGNRSIFEVEKAIVKRGRDARREEESGEAT
jgi:hypothetical protein